MHTSFFSEWNLGFFLGMVRDDQLGAIVAVQTIAADCNNSKVEKARALVQRKIPR
jgi:hypothetical protein